MSPTGRRQTSAAGAQPFAHAPRAASDGRKSAEARARRLRAAVRRASLGKSPCQQCQWGRTSTCRPDTPLPLFLSPSGPRQPEKWDFLRVARLEGSHRWSRNFGSRSLRRSCAVGGAVFSLCRADAGATLAAQARATRQSTSRQTAARLEQFFKAHLLRCVLCAAEGRGGGRALTARGGRGAPPRTLRSPAGWLRKVTS